MLKRFLSFSRAALGRSTFETDMDDELRFHLEARTADLIRGGLTPADAARRARVEFGSMEKHKEQSRASFGLRLLDEAFGDARYALRTFARNRSFTATAILTLALGIGANTAIFSLMDALMLRWLPVPNPQALLQVRFKSDTGNAGGSFSYAAVRALDDQRQVFSGVAGFSSSDFRVGTSGSTARVPGAIVTGSFYETLGLNPVIGRLLTRDDDRPGGPLVAVASYGYWERQFALDPSVAGRTVIMNGVPATIVGVSPRGFVGANVGQIADLTIPVATLPLVVPEMAGLLGPGNYWLRVLARPQPALSPAAAQAQIAARWPRIAEAVVAPHWPADRKKATVEAVVELVPGGTGWTYLREMYARPLRVLMTVVAVVLLIACANVASLLLARAAARQKEIAVRLAIGAGRGRIVRQLLVESALLSFAGAVCGLGLASIMGRFLLDRLSSGPSAVELDLTPNWHVLAFTAGVAIVTAILFGLAPALQATGFGPSSALKEEARSTASRSRLLPWLVTAQVALSLVLLVGAGLFVRSLRNLQRFDAGFARQGVLLVDLNGKRPTWSVELLEEIRRMPGVAAASMSTHTPLSGSTWSEAVVPTGQPLPNRDNAVFIGAGPGFFATMRIPVLSGREFTGRDLATSTAVAVVNERYAQRHFPDRNPVGQHLTARLSGEPRDLEIVGVVKNTNTQSLRTAPPAIVYLAFDQLPGNRLARAATLEIRTAGGLSEVTPTVRQALQSRFPEATVNVSALSAQVDASIVQERMMATLAGGFGLLALALASVGIYGLLAYGVARRTKEIGIHMALGAQRRKVIALVLRGARRSLLIGLAIGVPVAVGGSRWVESMLFGLKPTDPVAIVAAVLLLASVAHLAAYVPALRASRVDPLVALRHE